MVINYNLCNMYNYFGTIIHNYNYLMVIKNRYEFMIMSQTIHLQVLAMLAM